MRKINKLMLLTLGCLSAASGAHAATDPFSVNEKLDREVTTAACTSIDITKQINLVDSIDIALCNNPNTRSAWLNAKASAARVGQGKSDYLPQLTATGELAKTYSKNSVNRITNQGSSTTLAQNSTSYGPGITLYYLLYDFGSREANVESLKQQMRQYAYNYNSVMQATVFQVIQGYLGVFSAHENYDAAIKTEAAAKEAFEAAKAKFEVGIVTKADQAQAETAYSQSSLVKEQAENAMKLAEGNFAILLNLTPNQSLQLAAIDPLQMNAPLDVDVQTLIDEGLKNRPDLAASIAREQQAKANYRYTKTLSYPVISASGSSTKYDYINRDGDSQNSTIGVNLSVPLFTGFNNNYKKSEAKNLLEASKADREGLENNVKLDVWNTYHNYQTAQKVYQTAQVLQRSAEESEALALGRYKVGKGTLNDTLDTQASLADARRQLVEARYNILITRFDLFRALGSQTWRQDLTPVVNNSAIEVQQNNAVAAQAVPATPLASAAQMVTPAVPDAAATPTVPYTEPAPQVVNPVTNVPASMVQSGQQRFADPPAAIKKAKLVKDRPKKAATKKAKVVQVDKPVDVPADNSADVPTDKTDDNSFVIPTTKIIDLKTNQPVD